MENKLELYYPCKPLGIHQVFGRKDPIYTAMGMLGHNGIDFLAIHGQPIYASHDGYAYFETDSTGGEGVVIRSDKQYDLGNGPVYIKTIYWHMVDASKEPQFVSPITNRDTTTQGQPVKAGDLIGYADNTGQSTGDHCHFGLKTMALGEDGSSWYNTNQNNGYFGAIDPQPYFNGFFAQDVTSVDMLEQGIQEVTQEVKTNPQDASTKLGWLARLLNVLLGKF